MLTARSITTRHLLLAAACLHLTVAVAVSCAGRLELYPAAVNTDGIIFGMASDGIVYRAQLFQTLDELKGGGIQSWYSVSTQPFVKLLSSWYAAIGPVAGYSTLVAEPILLLFYLAVVLLVLKIGENVFDRSTGIRAAIIVAVWPTLLLHTVQPLRDSISIAAMLSFVLIAWKAVAGERSKPGRRGYHIALSSLALLILWGVKSDTWELVEALSLGALALSLISFFSTRPDHRSDPLLATSLLIFSILIPFALPPPVQPKSPTIKQTYLSGESSVSNGASQTERPAPLKSKAGQADVAARITSLRNRFADYYPEAASNIDADVRFTSAIDIVRYLPRAFLIGMFSPFPDMWFSNGGQVGRAGRLLGGMESLCVYMLAVFAAIALWRHRRNAGAWWLFLVAILGTAALGLVVVNVGALFRMRYCFWMMIIILGVNGLSSLLGPGRQGKESIADQLE